jgi:hypothetical protein
MGQQDRREYPVKMEKMEHRDHPEKENHYLLILLVRF